KVISFFIADCPDFAQLIVALGSEENPVFMATEVEHYKVIAMYGQVRYLVACRFTARLPEFSEQSRVHFNKLRNRGVARVDQAVSVSSQHEIDAAAPALAELL